MLRTTEQVAEDINIPKRTLEQWRYLGRGPKYVVTGRHVRYRDEDVAAWLDSQTVTPRGVA